ncbi:MAG: hypothetical protein ABW104_10405 [Candidatus Thiodiazotropha sp. 6PLUC2]
MANLNKSLIFAGSFSMLAALLHITIIIGGADWYRFFGAGEELALLSEQGSLLPAAITMAITIIFFTWAIYAFSGAGLVRDLPWVKPALVVITLIYLVRGLGTLPLLFFSPDLVDTFLVVTSIISSVIGIVHLMGYRQMIQAPQ